jgi:hypothetical protein
VRVPTVPGSQVMSLNSTASRSSDRRARIAAASVAQTTAPPAFRTSTWGIELPVRLETAITVKPPAASSGRTLSSVNEGSSGPQGSVEKAPGGEQKRVPPSSVTAR